MPVPSNKQMPSDEQVSAANASGRVPVVFIHGLWLLSSSWDPWARVFEEAGYAPVSAGWPDDPGTVAAANAAPDVLAGKTVGQVADHYSAVIVSGGRDHTIPRVVCRAAYKRQRRNPGVTEFTEFGDRGHSLTIDGGWKEVAQTSLDLVRRFS